MGKKVGFTGTHKGASEQQLQDAKITLELLKTQGFDEFHYGQCIGADVQVAKIAKALGYRVVSHPGLARDPKNLLFRGEFNGNDEVRDAKPFIKRDHDIVDETEVMIATPRSREEQVRSGTWTTVRYARKLGRVVHLLVPPFQPPKWAKKEE